MEDMEKVFPQLAFCWGSKKWIVATNQSLTTRADPGSDLLLSFLQYPPLFRVKLQAASRTSTWQDFFNTVL